MTSLPKISIVIPSLNKVDYIKKTLQSIFNQDYPNLEVIIQDGNSTDGTVEVIKKYAGKYPKIIKWESKKDEGQADAINKGFKKATGDVFAYINADDIYEKGALKKVEGYFARNPDTLWLAGRGRVIDKDGREIAKLVTFYKNICLKLNFYFLLLIFNFLYQPSVFLSRKAYEDYGPFVGEKYVMEYDLWLKLGKESMPGILSSYLSGFRLTSEGFSASAFRHILSEDYKIATKCTSNPLVLFAHRVNNLGRIAVVKLLRKCK